MRPRALGSNILQASRGAFRKAEDACFRGRVSRWTPCSDCKRNRPLEHHANQSKRDQMISAAVFFRPAKSRSWLYLHLETEFDDAAVLDDTT